MAGELPDSIEWNLAAAVVRSDEGKFEEACDLIDIEQTGYISYFKLSELLSHLVSN